MQRGTIARHLAETVLWRTPWEEFSAGSAGWTMSWRVGQIGMTLLFCTKLNQMTYERFTHGSRLGPILFQSRIEVFPQVYLR